MMTLYGHGPCLECYKVKLLAEHLSLSLREKEASPFKSGGSEPWILSVNPTGSVPVLETEDGNFITEANAILTFLAEGTPYYPDDPLTRAQVIQWMIFEQRKLPRSIGAIKYWIDTDNLDQLASDGLQTDEAIGKNALRILNAELAVKPFITGNGCTIADISIFAYCNVATDAEFDLSGQRHLTAWLERVQRQKGLNGSILPYPGHCGHEPINDSEA